MRTAIPRRRRRVPRQEPTRTARYHLESQLEPDWHECRVLDLSILGAALEIYEPVGHDLVGCMVSIEVQTVNPLTATLRNSLLTGVIRDVSSGSERAVRLGVQFVGDLPWSERALLDAYDRMRLSW